MFTATYGTLRGLLNAPLFAFERRATNFETVCEKKAAALSCLCSAHTRHACKLTLAVFVVSFFGSESGTVTTKCWV